MRLLQVSGARGLLRDFRKFAGPRYLLLLFLMWGGALAEAFGLLALVPIVTFASGPEDLPAYLGRVAGLADQLPPGGRFLAAIAFFVVVMIARALLLYRRDCLTAELTADYEASLKLRAAASLASGGWSRAARVGQGGLQSLLLTDIPRSVAAAHYWQSALVAAVLLIVQFGLAAILSPTMALAALLLIALGLGLSVPWIRKGEQSGLDLSDSHLRSSAAASRLHAGLKSALAQGTVPAFLREYGATLGDVTAVSIGFARDRARARTYAAAAAAICAALLLFVGSELLQLPLAILLTLLVLFARMSGPAQQLQQSFQALAGYAPAFAAVERHLGDSRDIPQEGAVEPLEWSRLSVDQVSFAHPVGSGRVDRLSLELGAGEWLGIAGASGAGKTTLIDLVAGLFVPDEGRILVDGAPLEGERLARWRRSLAYVSQAATVFDDSIRGNLLADGAQASDDRLWQVLEVVGLKPRVAALQEGLGALVGDRGSTLSGGERQRLTIARAILRGANLLILDEATNGLDSDAEIELLQRLRALDPRPAALLIAHRAAPLELCDERLEIVIGAEGAD